MASFHSYHSDVVGLVPGWEVLCLVVHSKQVLQDIHLHVFQSLSQGTGSSRILTDVTHIGRCKRPRMEDQLSMETWDQVWEDILSLYRYSKMQGIYNIAKKRSLSFYN